MSKYREKYFGKKDNFYNFRIGRSHFNKIQQKTNQNFKMTIIKGLICGIFFESLIVGFPIYENSVKKYTTRRLETKKVEEDHLRKRYLMQMRKKGKSVKE